MAFPGGPEKRSAIAVGLEWSTLIMTIAAQMVMPGVIGYWIDQKLGTRVLFLLIGFGLGSVLAGLALSRIVKKGSGPVGGRKNGAQATHDRRGQPRP